MPKFEKTPCFDFKLLFSYMERDLKGFHDLNQLAQRQSSYDPWRVVKYHPTPKGISPKLWWQFLLAQRQLSPVGDLLSASGTPFYLSKPDSLSLLLHKIDLGANFSIQTDRPYHGLNPEHLRTYLQSSLSESISSSQLEGAVTTSSLAKKMITEKREPEDLSERMILNNYLTMEVLKEWKDEPLTLSLLKKIHARLMENLPPFGKQGILREEKDQVRVIDPLGKIAHLPPPAKTLEERLEKLFNWVNQPDGEGVFLHPVVKAIILHFMIGYEHPFCDGNGRTARALFYWYLLRNEQSIWLPYLSISSVLKKPRWKEEYGRCYLDVEQDNFDLTYFVLFQLRVFLEAMQRFYDYVKRTLEERTQSSRIYPKGLNVRQIDLINHLQRHPDYIYTAVEHASWHHVSLNTARQDLATLAKLKYLKRIMRGKRMTYVSR